MRDELNQDQDQVLVLVLVLVQALVQAGAVASKTPAFLHSTRGHVVTIVLPASNRLYEKHTHTPACIPRVTLLTKKSIYAEKSMEKKTKQTPQFSTTFI